MSGGWDYMKKLEAEDKAAKKRERRPPPPPPPDTLVENVMQDDPRLVRLTFGEYSGYRLNDVPTHYLDWMLGTSMSGFLLRHVRKVLETRADWKRMDTDAD